jgi:hypothetical protein
MRQHFVFKIKTGDYQAVERGLKKFILQKNHLNYQVGDMLYLEEIVKGVCTGRKLLPMEIKYILHGGKRGLKIGYCIIGW